MQHLIDRDVDYGCAPAAHGFELGRGQALVDALLQGERAVQVRAHEAVLDLCGLAQHGD